MIYYSFTTLIYPAKVRGTSITHQRLVGTQQPEQLQTNGQHHKIALADYITDIYSDLGGTTVATLSPSCDAFYLFSPARFSPLSRKTPSTSIGPRVYPHLKLASTQRIRVFVIPTPTPSQRDREAHPTNHHDHEHPTGQKITPTTHVNLSENDHADRGEGDIYNESTIRVGIGSKNPDHEGARVERRDILPMAIPRTSPVRDLGGQVRRHFEYRRASTKNGREIPRSRGK